VHSTRARCLGQSSALNPVVVPAEQSIAHISRSGSPAAGGPRRLGLRTLRSGDDGAGWAAQDLVRVGVTELGRDD
jgi:hypothetical protein